MTTRILGPDDAEALEAFLLLHRDSSMFLRTNLRRGGLVDRGEMFQSTYAGAFDGDRLVGVAAHGWNGDVLVQAPQEVDSVVRACVQATGRKVKGMNGPLAHARAARRALGLQDARASMDGHEGLYTVHLDDLVLPPVLTTGAVATRPARPDEHALLREWRVAYDIELFAARDTPEERESAWSPDHPGVSGPPPGTPQRRHFCRRSPPGSRWKVDSASDLSSPQDSSGRPFVS